MNENTYNKPASDEIDLIELIRHLWNGRMLIIKITAAFIALGLFVAFTSQKQYMVEVKMLPEIKNSSTSGASALLKQFGSLAGFSMPLGEGADAIGPMLYPDMLKSTPFYLELLNHKITYNTNDETLNITVYEYLDDYTKTSLFDEILKYTIKLPWTILGWFRSEHKEDKDNFVIGQKQFIRITKKQYDRIKSLQNKITSDIDQKNGIIRVSAEFGDPYIAAQIANFSVNYISNYITEYRIKKAKADLNFIKERFIEKEKEYLNAQEELALFRDANRNVQSASARTEEERLNNRYALAFNVYNGLAQQLEQAKIRVQEETPVIKILEPVKVPVERSKPKRSLILILFSFLGGIFGVGTILGQFVIKSIKEKLNKQE